MKKIFKPIFAIVAGMFISNTLNSKELEVNNRVMVIRKSISEQLKNNNDSELLTYYKSISEKNNNSKINLNLNDSETPMQWHNNPNWNKNWNNYWNQVTWRNWNKF